MLTFSLHWPWPLCLVQAYSLLIIIVFLCRSGGRWPLTIIWFWSDPLWSSDQSLTYRTFQHISITSVLIFLWAGPCCCVCERCFHAYSAHMCTHKHAFLFIYSFVQTPIGISVCKMHASAYLAALDLKHTLTHTHRLLVKADTSEPCPLWGLVSHFLYYTH